MQPASRACQMKPFMVMDVLEAAQDLEARGRSVVHLEIGEPDFDTPQCIKDAAIKALQQGHTHYTHSLGLQELRQAICRNYQENYQVQLDPEQIIVTSGTSPALLLCFAALLEPGQNVIISDPGYPCYANFIKFVNGQPLTVQVHEEEGFQYSVQDVKSVCTPDTRAIMINSPANPTGTLLDTSTLQELSEIGPYIVSDEIYHGLVYSGQEHSILEFTDQAFVLNGFSKLYAMTGWRLGYLICPKPFVREIQKMAQNLYICAGSIAQWAGITALEKAGPDVQRMKEIFDERRLFLLQGLNELGFKTAVEPTGAFYVLANAKLFSHDSYKLAFDILEKAGVGVTPGVDFGPNAEGFLRFSYANSLENIDLGLQRLEEYLRRTY